MLQRRTPMKSASSLKRTGFARKASPAPAPRQQRPKLALVPATRRAVIAPVSGAVVALPKQPRERCQHLLDMAKGKPCLFWFVTGCRGSEGSTTVKAHDNRLSANKGKGLKAHDWRSVDACEPCHTAYDQGNKHTREQKDAAFDAAYERQLAAWHEIFRNPAARQKDREAAKWAINRYQLHQLKGDLS